MAWKDDYFDSVFSRRILLSFLILNGFVLSSCAYHWGFADRSLPGGYQQVAIPMFENKSEEVGLEVDFTRALIERFHRSKVARIQDKDTAPVFLDGKIIEIKGERGLGASSLERLPDRAVLNAEYLVTVISEINLIRESDQKILWSRRFVRAKAYSAPRVGTPVVNSVNATYNDSNRREVLRALAEESMLDAHNQLTENF